MTCVSQIGYSFRLSRAHAFTAYEQARDPKFEFRIAQSLPSGRIADLCAHHLLLDARERQAMLEMLDVSERVRKVADALAVQLALVRREPRETMN